MSRLADVIQNIQNRTGDGFGTRLLLPLFFITAFCFAYTEFRIQNSKAATEPWQASTSTQQKQTSTDTIKDIPLAKQDALPEISVQVSAEPANAQSLDGTESTSSQVPNANSNANPQGLLHSAKSLQNTISQELYISLLHSQGSD